MFVLDIETSNLDMKSEGLTFENPEGWNISCICVYDSDYDANWVFTDSDSYVPTKDEAVVSLVGFCDFMQNVSEDQTFLTHNGVRFDFPIIQSYMKRVHDRDLSALIESMNHFDTADYLLQATGVRYRLNHMIHYHLGEEASKLMDAANAPIAWSEGRHNEVIDYCLDDCLKTYRVFMDAKERRHFSAIGKEEYAEVSFPFLFL